MMEPWSSVDEVVKHLRVVQDSIVLGPQARLAPFLSGHTGNGAPARRDSSSHIAFAFVPVSKRLLVIAPHVLERRGPVGAELDHPRTLDDAIDGFRGGLFQHWQP